MKMKKVHIDLGGISYEPNVNISGIPRVTLSLAKSMVDMGRYRDVDLNLMSLLDEDFKVPENVLNKFELGEACQVLPSSNGIIFLLDSYYYKYNFLNKSPINLRNNFTVVDYIHDILPVTTKGLFDIPEFKFKNWIRQTFQFSDAVMCPSKRTADDIINYISSETAISVGQSLKLGYNFHGADFSTKQERKVSDRLSSILKRDYFLMVGSVEIRKNHLYVLNAFEILWSRGVNVTLCIAGRIGWSINPLLEKLRNHPERDKRLLFISGPTDDELAQLYSNSYCLIFASIDEGFGLPIIEAAHYKVPLLLSDITIFHEIAGEHARYFSLKNVDYLVQAILNFSKDVKAGGLKEDSSQIKEITWLQSAMNILDDIIDDRWYCTIHADKSVEYHTD